MNYSLNSKDKGIVLKISGYNEKLHLLIELITKHLKSFNSTKEMFEAVKEKLTQIYFNNLRKPNNLAKYVYYKKCVLLLLLLFSRDVRLTILVQNYHSLVEKYNTISTVTFDDMKQFAENFIKKLYVKVLVQGNLTQENALKIVNNFVSELNCEPIAQGSYPKVNFTFKCQK